MKNYINLFLSKKINYEVENSNTFINPTTNNNERIIKRETRQLNNVYTFYDLLYLTCNTLNDANNNYDKLYSIIYASDNEEDIINTIINAQN